MTVHARGARRALAALAALVLSACGGASSASSSTPRIDPNAPDERAFQAALARYDAGTAAHAAARLAADPTAQNATAVTEFGAAEGGFHRLLIDFPASVRADNAAYLEGRSRYEIGTITGLRIDFEKARTLLEAAIAAHGTAKTMDSMTYFAGRAIFRIAEVDRAATTDTAAVQAQYALAKAQFVRSVAVNPGAPWGDNAAYYLGRCDFEIGELGVHPLDPLAKPGSDAAPFDRAEAELAAVPAASTYYDNARYYRGRSFFEEPTTSAVDPAAARQANLASAVGDLATVIGLPGPSSFAVPATYWRGRAHYALAFQGTPVDPVELPLALADMKAVAPTASVYADNALYFAAKSYLHLAGGPYCATTRSGDAAPASACAALKELRTRLAASVYVGQAEAYLLANGCDPAACPP
ncbi:MAG TPA: hypothetical protein VFL83_06245 [Anaeromyxobacter sp.]|nr:hypothetical protein [Anaeromyxobacter sp.]